MKLSVITATYNSAETLADCLKSVNSQSFVDMEQLIVDGGSTDNSVEIAKQQGARVSSLISEPDDGIYDALNKGLRRATGDIVGFLHADDLYAGPQVLAKIAAAFEDTTVDAVYGDLVYVDRRDVSRVVRYWRAGEFKRSHLRKGWMPPHPTFYVRRSVYERLGEFDTSFRISADYDSIVRFLHVADIRTAYVPEVLVRMRIGGISNASLRTIMRKSAEDLQIVRRHGLGDVPTLLAKNLGKLGQFWRR